MTCFAPYSRALNLDPTVIMKSDDDPGEKNVWQGRKTNSLSVPLELRGCEQLTVTSRCLHTCRVSQKKINELNTHSIAGTVAVNRTECNSPSFQTAGNLCEAHYTKVREKTSFMEDTLSGQQTTEYTLGIAHGRYFVGSAEH